MSTTLNPNTTNVVVTDPSTNSLTVVDNTTGTSVSTTSTVPNTVSVSNSTVVSNVFRALDASAITLEYGGSVKGSTIGGASRYLLLNNSDTVVTFGDTSTLITAVQGHQIQLVADSGIFLQDRTSVTGDITASGDISASGIVYSNELNIQGTGRIYSPAPDNSLIIDGTGDSNITFNDSEADTDILIRGNKYGWYFFKADAATENVGIGGDWGTSVPGQELTVHGNISSSGTVYANDLILDYDSLPDSNPSVKGQVFRKGGVLYISAG